MAATLKNIKGVSTIEDMLYLSAHSFNLISKTLLHFLGSKESNALLNNLEIYNSKDLSTP